MSDPANPAHKSLEVRLEEMRQQHQAREYDQLQKAKAKFGFAAYTTCYVTNNF